jgi:hypothetical protein
MSFVGVGELVSKILAIDVLVVGLIGFSLGTTLTRRIGRTIRFARIGGFALGVVSFASFSSSMSHQPTFHAPPDWFIALFLSGPSFILGFVLGGIAGFLGEPCAPFDGQKSRRIQQLWDATRHLWTVGSSVVGVGVALGMPAKFSDDGPVKARLATHFGPVLLWLGVGLALLSTGLAICGCFRVGPQFRRVAMVELAFGLPVLAVIIILQFAF